MKLENQRVTTKSSYSPLRALGQLLAHKWALAQCSIQLATDTIEMFKACYFLCLNVLMTLLQSFLEQ